MAGTETYTEYRLTWDYPYLRNNGMVEYAIGKTVAETRGNACKNEGFYWAGREIKWDTRSVTHSTTEWEDFEVE